MKARTPLILAVILLLVAGFYYIYDVRISKEKEEKKTKTDKIFQLDDREITSLKITRGKDSIEFKKTELGWMIAGPEQMTASSTTLDSFVTELRDLKKEDTIDEKPSDLAPFELKPPKYELRLKTADPGGQEYSLSIGGKNPSGSFYYAQVPGNPAVISITAQLSSNLDMSVADYREKDALPFEPEKVTSLLVKYKDRELGLENPQNFWTQFRKNPEWKIIKPVQAKGEGSKITTFLWDIKGIKVEKFLEGKERDAAAGQLGEPALEITVQQVGRSPETLVIGKAGRDKKSHVCMRKSSGEYLTANIEDLKKLDRKYEDLENTHIADFPVNRTERYEVKTADMTIKAEKKDGEWKLQEPKIKAKKKEQEAIPSLGTLSLRIENTCYTEKKGAEESIPEVKKEPFVTVTLYNKDKSTIGTFRFWEIPGTPGKYYAQVEPSGYKGYYVVDDTVITLIKTMKDEIKEAEKKAMASPSVTAPSPSSGAPVPAPSVLSPVPAPSAGSPYPVISVPGPSISPPKK